MGNTFVQSATSAIPPASYSSDNTEGNVLVSIFGFSGFGDINSVSDSQGNTWIRGPATVHISGFGLSCWYTLNCKAGANSVSASYGFSPGLFVGQTIGEWSGASLFDLSASASGTSGAASVSASASASSELAIGCVLSSTAIPGSGLGAGWNLRSNSLKELLQDDLSVSGLVTAECDVVPATSWIANLLLFNGSGMANTLYFGSD
jgi:hypothetical protein